MYIPMFFNGDNITILTIRKMVIKIIQLKIEAKVR
jgi:hypothetical protein